MGVICHNLLRVFLYLDHQLPLNGILREEECFLSPSLPKQFSMIGLSHERKWSPHSIVYSIVLETISYFLLPSLAFCLSINN